MHLERNRRMDATNVKGQSNVVKKANRSEKHNYGTWRKANCRESNTGDVVVMVFVSRRESWPGMLLKCQDCIVSRGGNDRDIPQENGNTIAKNYDLPRVKRRSTNRRKNSRIFFDNEVRKREKGNFSRMFQSFHRASTLLVNTTQHNYFHVGLYRLL